MGDREKFFFQLAFEPPADPDFAAPEEDALSWGSFQLWVDGRNLCRHAVGTEESQAVYWHLLPFMEWLVEHWDYLFHEQRPPVRNAAQFAWQSLAETNSPLALEHGGEWDFQTAAMNAEWSARHSITTCREGGLFPEIIIRRFWSDVEISWGDRPPPGAPAGFRFVESSGAARLPVHLVAEPVHNVLAAAVRALQRSLPESKRLALLEKNLSDLATPRHQPRRLAILAGLGEDVKEWVKRWFSLRKALVAQFGDASTALAHLFGGDNKHALVVEGSCEGALMFGAAAPTLSDKDVFNLAARLVTHSLNPRTEDKLAPRARLQPPNPRSALPWQEGYQLAQEWAKANHLDNPGQPVDVEGHLAAFGVSVDDLAMEDEEIGGVAIARRDRSPLILLNTHDPRNRYPSGRRFSLAHELCHLLYDRRAGAELALISGPWAPIELEKRAKAFAAMLLMPDALVERAFGEAGVSPSKPSFQDLLTVAGKLEVSPNALAHHLSYRGWISPEKTDLLLEELSNRSV
jgi:Zn-dependent peptidase ImmA (M78 family)